MILPLLALVAAQQAVPDTALARPDPYRPAPATIVAEPVALFIAAADRDRDGRTTLAELRQTIADITADWGAGVGYIAYSDWAERWLGDRNGIPTPFELDRDGDNRVTVAELTARMDALHARFDTNRDGAVSRAELLTVRSAPFGGDDRRGRGGRR
jgi:hypothetical protein